MNKIDRLYEEIPNAKWAREYQAAIQKFGLVFDDFTPNIYGDERKFMNQTRDELGIYQTPLQFAQYLDFLDGFNIESYLEIGVFRGGTMLVMDAYFKKKMHDVQITGIDITPENLHPDAKPYIDEYCHPFDSTVFYLGDSNPEFDLVFIDGDHSYKGVIDDWKYVGQYAKICALHDINEPSCPDVIRAWQEIKAEAISAGKKIKEFTDSVGGFDTHGIGVIY